MKGRKADITVLACMIRQLRQGAGMSIRELAHAAALSPAYVARIENGDAHPSEEVIVQLARSLGVDVLEIAPSDTGEEPARAVEQGFVRANMRYVIRFDDERWTGQARRDAYVGMRIFYSYDLFNPADTTLEYTLVSELEAENEELGPIESRFEAVAFRHERPNGDEFLSEDQLSPVDRGLMKQLTLRHPVPARGRVSVQVQLYTVELLDFHRPWWVTYPTERMSVVVLHPPWLKVSVRSHHTASERFRLVLNANGFQWYELNDHLLPSQGVDVYWFQTKR